MSFRLPTASVLALASALIGVAGTARAQTSDPPARQVPQHLTRSCGGFAGFACPKGQLCLDDPSDDCDPDRGGADCIGICVKKSDCRQPPACNYNNPRRRYVAKSPEQCAAIRFICQPGFQAFFDDCGCGCELVREQQEQGAPPK
ncbi:hypothetical protein [Archangium lansingense]|uniref:Kazal-type serine protease inhibitor-like protein n=1 Tax=Archangium lansingense TaxID=2995310 RepID=A0ABT4A213_9BACT|nr:hypothetical protein [Archangium lansinium]MCY1075688.1 hypothetical protein [Archangium lansinium]